MYKVLNFLLLLFLPLPMLYLKDFGFESKYEKDEMMVFYFEIKIKNFIEDVCVRHLHLFVLKILIVPLNK